MGYGGQAGYYTDWETGTAPPSLALLTFRYYDPSAGRFLTRDPIGYKGGANPYEYVGDGPTGKSDPSGLLPNIGGAIGACLGAITGVIAGITGDPCNADAGYNSCLQIGDCLADAVSALAQATFVFFFPELGFVTSFFLGCAEGVIAAIGHNIAENICRDKFHPCTLESSSPCKWISDAADIAAACLDGLIGKYLDGWLGERGAFGKGIIEAHIEAFIALLANQYESSDCEGAG